MRPHRVLLLGGQEIDVTAEDRDVAEMDARYQWKGQALYEGGRLRVAYFLEDLGEAWSVIDLVEYPDPSTDDTGETT